MINKNTSEKVDLVIVGIEETLTGDASAEAWVEVEEGEEVYVYLEYRYGNNDLEFLYHCVSMPGTVSAVHVRFREVGGMLHCYRNNEQIQCQALGTVKSYSGIVVMLDKRKPVQSRMRHEVHTHSGTKVFENRKNAYDYVENEFGKSSENDDLWRIFIEGSDWFGKDYYYTSSDRYVEDMRKKNNHDGENETIEVD